MSTPGKSTPNNTHIADRLSSQSLSNATLNTMEFRSPPRLRANSSPLRIVSASNRICSAGLGGNRLLQSPARIEKRLFSGIANQAKISSLEATSGGGAEAKHPEKIMQSPGRVVRARLGYSDTASTTPGHYNTSIPFLRQDNAQESASKTQQKIPSNAISLIDTEEGNIGSTTKKPSPSSKSSHVTTLEKKLSPPKKALSTISSSYKSMCFSTEDPVTSMDATPDGQCIIIAFSNGSVRTIFTSDCQFILSL